MNFFGLEIGLNELSWLGYLFFNYTFILLVYRYWGKVGLLLFVLILYNHT